MDTGTKPIASVTGNAAAVITSGNTGGKSANSATAKSDRLIDKFGTSVMAAFVAEFVTYPLDLIKTRLQIQGEGGGGGTAYRGMISTGVGVAREEGIRALWQGVAPALSRHVIYSGVRMTLYDIGREKLTNSHGDTTFLHRAVLGMTAGAVGQFVASPTDLVKVRMQMEGQRRLQGSPARLNGMADAFRQILREGGVRGMWKGVVPNVQRAALVNLGDITTYDQSKRFLMDQGFSPDSWITHTICSVIVGFNASILSTPADVIKSRMMNQPVDEFGRGKYYRGSVDCFLQAVRKEGFMSLYKGFFPCWLRIAPWSLVFWVFLEKFRTMSNMKSF